MCGCGLDVELGLFDVARFDKSQGCKQVLFGHPARGTRAIGGHNQAPTHLLFAQLVVAAGATIDQRWLNIGCEGLQRQWADVGLLDFVRLSLNACRLGVSHRSNRLRVAGRLVERGGDQAIDALVQSRCFFVFGVDCKDEFELIVGEIKKLVTGTPFCVFNKLIEAGGTAVIHSVLVQVAERVGPTGDLAPWQADLVARSLANDNVVAFLDRSPKQDIVIVQQDAGFRLIELRRDRAPINSVPTNVARGRRMDRSLRSNSVGQQDRERANSGKVARTTHRDALLSLYADQRQERTWIDSNQSDFVKHELRAQRCQACTEVGSVGRRGRVWRVR